MKGLATDLRAVLTTSRVLDAPAELRTFAYDASFLTQLAPRSPDVVVLARDGVAAANRVTGWALEQGVELRGFSVRQPSLEDVYLRLTEEAVAR